MTDITLKPVKVLVAVEASESSRKTLEKTFRLVNLSQTEFLIFSVEESIVIPAISSVPGVLGGDMVLSMQQEAEMLRLEKERTLAALNWAEKACKEAGVKYAIRSESGDPKHLICDVAKQEEVDLIVVGSEIHGFLERLIIGSVSEFVVKHACCSIMVVH